MKKQRHLFIFHRKRKKVRDQARGGAASLSPPYRVRSSAQNGFYSWAAQCGIPALLLLERGGQGECGQNGRLKYIRKMCWN